MFGWFSMISLCLGFVLSIFGTFYGGFSTQNSWLMIGFGFLIGGGMLYIISGVASAIFSSLDTRDHEVDKPRVF